MPKKMKLDLSGLKVQSFVTSLDSGAEKKIKAGETLVSCPGPVCTDTCRATCEATCVTCGDTCATCDTCAPTCGATCGTCATCYPKYSTCDIDCT